MQRFKYYFVYITIPIYQESNQDVRLAIVREKEINKWRREKKNKLVKFKNPEWKDLSFDLE